HWSQPPDAAPSTGEPVRDAMRLTFHHWGLHAWSIYAAFAVPLAYYHFRHGLPLAPRSLLWPLLGERIHGPLGHVVDVLCTVGTLFGVATSLGLGATQINAGLHALFGLPVGVEVQLALIAGITLVATISVVSGLHRGIRLLSRSNMALAGLLLVFVLVTGPTLYLLELFTTSLGAYLQKLPATSLWTEPGRSDGWQSRWTLFYWSWWISWSPFVGVFVARISRGRTISEFVAATLALPSVATFFWFTVVGGTGIHLSRAGAAAGELAGRAVDQPPLSLFLVLDELPLAGLTHAAATVLVLVFFVTSSDSGSLVDDMVTSGGHPDPPRAQRVFWAVAEGAVAATLLVAGGLQALRTASLTTGLPLAVLLLASSAGLLRALRVDASVRGAPATDALHEETSKRAGD
ncbi:MAG: BCCT family transporter, partial [Myxococcota bacterium]|nr:BCCT family transporter [Myxococcota bacterium]